MAETGAEAAVVLLRCEPWDDDCRGMRCMHDAWS